MLARREGLVKALGKYYGGAKAENRLDWECNKLREQKGFSGASTN